MSGRDWPWIIVLVNGAVVAIELIGPAYILFALAPFVLAACVVIFSRSVRYLLQLRRETLEGGERRG